MNPREDEGMKPKTMTDDLRTSDEGPPATCQDDRWELHEPTVDTINLKVILRVNHRDFLRNHICHAIPCHVMVIEGGRQC